MVIKVFDQVSNTLRLFTVSSTSFDTELGEACVLSDTSDKIFLRMSPESYDILLCQMYSDCKVDVTDCQAWVNVKPPRTLQASVAEGSDVLCEDEYAGFNYVIWLPVLIFTGPLLVLGIVGLLKFLGV